jgi:hypothetical protein
MLGKTQAISNQPYQVYQGPMTAGESGLQNKVFQGLGSLNFPSQLGQSFSSSGAYQPPQMNMGAYQPQPIGAGQPFNPDNLIENTDQLGGRPMSDAQRMLDMQSRGNMQEMLNQGSNGFGDFGSMPDQRGANENEATPFFDYASQYLNANKQQAPSLSDPNIQAMMANKPFGGQFGQMPQGGLASLMGRMPQQTQQQTQQQPQNIAQSYMNPYLQSVLTPQIEELRRQNEITNMGTNAKLTGAGAYGGGRQAIMNAENNRNLMQEMNRTVGTGYANAYDKAMGQFNTEQGQAKTLADMMSQAGGQQRGIEQEGISADYNEFLAQRDYPQKMLQFQQSMLQGLPISTVSTSPASQTGLGALQSTVGTLGSTYDLLKKLKVID